MSGTKVLRTALVASGALAAAAFAASSVAAQDAIEAVAEAAHAADAEAPARVSFRDPQAPFSEQEGALALSVRDDTSVRISPLDNMDEAQEDQRRIEMAIAAGGGDAPLDISIAQRASLGVDRNGDLARQGRGSELRVGRGLTGERRGERNSTYVFVASDNEALTWQPGARNDFGGRGSSFALQDRVEVGDVAAGVTWERDGVQTSLAYVEREESTRVGNQSFSHDESFAGVTVTMRR